MIASKLRSILRNRELSWLDFNERVLIAAEQDEMPLLERLKFLGIFSSNLDEFYSVRVGSLHRLLIDSEENNIVNRREIEKTISSILDKVTMYNIRVEQLFKKIVRELNRQKVFFIDEQHLSPDQETYLEHFFTNKVRSRLFPIMLRKNRDFPFLKNISIYLAISMYRKEDPAAYQYALIEIPESLPRYIVIPSNGDETWIIILDDVIRLNLSTIFNAFDFDVFEGYTIKITRDAEYSLEEEVTKSLFEKLSESIRQRSSGDPVRVVYDSDMPEHLREYVTKQAGLESCENKIAGGKYHNMRDLIDFPKIKNKELYYPKHPNLPHYSLDNTKSLINQVLERDYLLTLPFHRFGYIIDLLREAALDPAVTTIKMTLYRVANDSNIINALLNAARNGKHIVAFIEIQARFNEEENLHWTETLSKEKNVTLISGLEGLKVHSKLAVITRKEPDTHKNRRISIISTGNFNEKTAKIYSDHILLTADPTISNEVNKVFKQLQSNFQVFKFKELLVAPNYLRNKLTALIRREISHARKGLPSGILLKINNILDDHMIKWLCSAAEEGVPVTLLVRGICAFIPGVSGISDKVEVRALIGRYLEHTRIYRFANNGNRELFIGSTDLMPRNLNRRVEVLTPIKDPEIKDELDHYLTLNLHDRYGSFRISKENMNELIRHKSEIEFPITERIDLFSKEQEQASRQPIHVQDRLYLYYSEKK